MAKVDCSELAQTITDLAMHIAADPDVRDLDDVMVEMKKLLPEIRRESLVEYIAEATTRRTQQATELEKKLLAIRREARSDKGINRKIDALRKYLATGQMPPKPKPKPGSPEAIKRLRATRDNLRKWLQNSDPVLEKRLTEHLNKLNAMTPEEVLAVGADPKLHAEVQAIQNEIDVLHKKMRDKRVESALTDKVESLQKHLSEGTLPEKTERRDLEGTEAANTLRELVKDLRGKLAKSPPAQKARLEGQIADLEKKLETGDILPKVREKEIPQTKELERLEYQRDLLRRRIQEKIRKMKPMSIFEKASAPGDFARAMITSVDVSAVGRQGWLIALGHPIRATRAMGPMFKALVSTKAYMKAEKEILNDPIMPFAARSKLYIAPMHSGATFTEREERFRSTLAEKIPWVAASNRAYVTFLNKLRLDSFKAMTKAFPKNGTPTQDEAEAIANMINVFSGRGKMVGRAQMAVDFLNIPFFATRYNVSRFQVLLGQPFYKGSMRTRMMIAREYGRFLAGLAVLYGIAKLFNASIEVDPRSSDFGKIRIGNVRIDPLAGLSQATVFIARMVTQKTKTQKGLVPLRGEDVPYGGQKTSDVIKSFLRSKLSPTISIPLNIAEGENVVGDPVSILSTLRDMVVPLSVQDITKAIQDQGIAKGMALSLLLMFGMGIQIYGEPQSQATQSAPKRPERTPQRR